MRPYLQVAQACGKHWQLHGMAPILSILYFFASILSIGSERQTSKKRNNIRIVKITSIDDRPCTECWVWIGEHMTTNDWHHQQSVSFESQRSKIYREFKQDFQTLTLFKPLKHAYLQRKPSRKTWNSRTSGTRPTQTCVVFLLGGRFFLFHFLFPVS